MRDFHPSDDVVFPEGYSPQETLDDFSPEIPNPVSYTHLTLPTKA